MNWWSSNPLSAFYCPFVLDRILYNYLTYTYEDCFKYEYLCCEMKLLQKIPNKFLLITAVLFCYGISTYSNYGIQPNCIEFSEGKSSNNNRLISHIDSFNDDQIPQIDDHSLFSKSILSIHTLQDAFLIHYSYLRIWQPPKV